MSFLRDLVIRIKGDKTQLDSTLNDASKKVKGFASILPAIGVAATAAFAVLVSWVKDTSIGLEAMNVGLKASKQLLTDLIMGQGLHIKEAIKNAKEQSKIQQDDIREGYQIKTLQSQLAQLIRESADQTLSHSERLKKLTEAMAKEKELKEFLLADAREELKNAFEAWKLNLASVDAKKRYYEVAGRIRDIEGSDSRRLQSQFTAELVAQKKRADELVDAFTPLPKIFDELSMAAANFMGGRGLLPQSGLKIGISGRKNQLAMGPASGNQEMANAMAAANTDAEAFAMSEADLRAEDFQKQWVDNWKQATDEVTSMISDAFIGVFEAIGSGSFQGFGDQLLQNFGSFIANFGKMLVAMGTSMLLAQTLLKAPSIPTAIAAIAAGGVAMAVGGMMMGMASRQSGNLGGTGGSSGASNLQQQNMKVEVYGKIKGKDIVISSRRYIEENG
jgi:hypothetical protein